MDSVFRSEHGSARAAEIADTVVIIFDGMLTVAESEALDSWLHAHVQVGSQVLMVIVSGHTKLDPTLRRRTQHLADWLAMTTAMQAVVIEMKGVSGAFMRAIVAGISYLAPKTGVSKVFDDASAGATWMALLNGNGTNAAVILDTVERLRQDRPQ